MYNRPPWGIEIPKFACRVMSPTVKNWCRSVQGFSIPEGLKIGVFHWQGSSPLQQFCTIDTITCYEKHCCKVADVVFTGVWITTGGTMYNDAAKYTGKALYSHMQQSGTSCPKPVLVGFANLKDVRSYREIKQGSHSVVDRRTDERVRWLNLIVFIDRIMWFLVVFNERELTGKGT